jgi:hypothetical protein
MKKRLPLGGLFFFYECNLKKQNYIFAFRY